MDMTSGSIKNNNEGANAFYKTGNQQYGVNWQCSKGLNPLQMKETPEYKDLVIYLWSEGSPNI